MNKGVASLFSAAADKIGKLSVIALEESLLSREVYYCSQDYFLRAAVIIGHATGDVTCIPSCVRPL